MADISAVPLNPIAYSENVANNLLGLIGDFEFTVNSGTGTVTQELASEYGISSVKVFNGNKSLKISNTDYQNTDLVFSNVSDDYGFVTDTPQNYYVSAFFYLASGAINTTVRLDIFQDASPYQTLVFGLNSSTIPAIEEWYRLGQNIRFDSGYVYTFKWTLVKEPAHSTNSLTLYVGGFAIQTLNKGSQEESPYLPPKALVLETTQTIDIPSISSNNSYTVVTTLNGAKVGDFITGFTFPAELISLGLVVGFPLVTDDDEISFIVHNHTGGSVNPASGDYTLKITK